MENREIARILRETAHLLEIDGAIIGRYRSYEKAAELIASIPESVEQLALDPEKLKELPGVGDRLAEHIQEILKTGDYSLRRKLLKKYPATILDVLNLQSLGPKKGGRCSGASSGAGSVDAVENLAREGKLRDLPGFGEKSETNILKAIEVYKQISGRFLLDFVEAQAAKLAAHIGGLWASWSVPWRRRGRSAAARKLSAISICWLRSRARHSQKNVDGLAQHILGVPGKCADVGAGRKQGQLPPGHGLAGGRTSARAGKSRRCLALLHRVERAQRGSARARQQDGLDAQRIRADHAERRTARRRDDRRGNLDAKLKLDFIPPELRENTGEIEAAEHHKLPHLIELADIRGDLQMHTTASDGRNSIEEMAAAARALGYDYIALTDHSKAVTVANGLDEKRTREQIRKIHAANAKKPGIRILAGSEVDILKDGRLDLDDDVLAELDVVVASVHSYMNLERAEMTERLLAAIENPYTQILGHPTGRLLLRREGFPFDMEAILAAAARHGVAVECNASPERLDLKDTYLRMAKERGVPVVVSTDAHTTTTLQFMHYGVRMARRGWLEKRDVINTLPLEKFLAALRPKPTHRAHGDHGSAKAGRKRAATG